MKITGIQNCISINQPHLESKKAAPKTQRQDYNYQYNPIYYMPTFKSQTTDNFTRLFNKGLEEDLSQDELDKLSHYIRNVEGEVACEPDNFIGEGAFGTVYRINDDYVLKVDYSCSMNKDGKFKYNKDKKFNDLPYYYGGVLANCDNLLILRNADPRGDAVISGKPTWMGSKEATEYLVNTSLPAFASLPQESYDNFANVLKLLNDKKVKLHEDTVIYSPDTFNPNNFMIVDNEIRFVDELTHIEDKKNGLYTMIEPFLRESYVPEASVDSDEAIEYKREIFKKCVLASEGAELPLPSGIRDCNGMTNIMKRCSYSSSLFDLLQFIDNGREQEPDKEKRKQNLSDYLDSME